MSELPDFEGQVPVGVNTKINGAGQRIVRALHADEKVILLVEARVKKVGHTVTDEGLKREHVLRVDDLFELAPGEADKLVKRHRSEAKKADDARRGRAPLPGFDGAVDDTEHPGLELAVDGSGVSLGDTVLPGLLDPEATYTIVFLGGTKALWPDDWDGAGQSLVRCAGGRMRTPGAEPGVTDVVVQVLDVDTGAVVSEWTANDEAVRLELLEERLAAEEAAEDRAAMDELESRRTPQVGGVLVNVAPVKDVKAWLAEQTDGAVIARCWHAEKRLKGRPGVLTAALGRLAELQGRSADEIGAELEGGA